MRNYGDVAEKARDIFVGIDVHRQRWHVTVQTARVVLLRTSIGGVRPDGAGLVAQSSAASGPGSHPRAAADRAPAPAGTMPDQGPVALLWSGHPLPGGTLGPFESWLVLRGLKTLLVRIERHSFNAKRITKYLRSLEIADRVFLPRSGWQSASQ
jgi:hypothetical protein